MEKNKKIVVFLIIGWLILIFIFSAMTSRESNLKSVATISQTINFIITKTNSLGLTNKNLTTNKINKLSKSLNIPFRKCMHASIYFVLAIFILIYYHKKDIPILNKIIYTIFLCFLFALLDEYHQTFVAGRYGQMLDVFIDMIGSILAIILWFFIEKILKNSKKRQISTKEHI